MLFEYFAENDKVPNDVISLHASKTHFQMKFTDFKAYDPPFWHEGANDIVNLKYYIEIGNKASTDHF